jgi:hypothetical protein
MRIPSGKTDQVIYFVAVDPVDLKTRETGLSSFTVYRSRNGAAPILYTTPTVTEISAANMPGVYSILIDEDTTIAAGSDSEEYCVHITQAAMAPVTRTVELYRRDTATGQTLSVASGRALSDVDTIKTQAVTASGGVTFPAATLASTTNITAATGIVLSGVTHTGAVIPTVSAVTGLTASNLDVAVSSRMATYTQPTGFLAATFPTGTIANTTNITAGTITTATNVTNAVTVGIINANVITATSIAADAITDAKVASDVTISAVTGSVGSVTTAVTVGTINANVITATSIANDAITAAKIATDAIDGDALAASAITEIQSGLATSSSLTTTDGKVDAIKAKTDSLTYSVANQVDANIQYVNNILVNGNGQLGTEWGP